MVLLLQLHFHSVHIKEGHWQLIPQKPNAEVLYLSVEPPNSVHKPGIFTRYSSDWPSEWVCCKWHLQTWSNYIAFRMHVHHVGVVRKSTWNYLCTLRIEILVPIVTEFSIELGFEILCLFKQSPMIHEPVKRIRNLGVRVCILFSILIKMSFYGSQNYHSKHRTQMTMLEKYLGDKCIQGQSALATHPLY